MSNTQATNTLSLPIHYEPDTFICDCCDEEYPAEERFYVSGQTICRECYEEQTVCCSHCGEVILSEHNEGNDDTPLCHRCRDYYYYTCTQCGTLIRNLEAYYDDEDEPYCEDCYEKYHLDTIHEYSYKPDPIFYGDGPRYFGVELEIDDGGKSCSNARELLNIANKSAKHLYVKSDGSLDDGMELVTHPCSLEYHMEQFPWKNIVREALDLGYYSHKTSTCGLHIHVNRSSFSPDTREQESCIGRILFFIEKHWEELLQFSRRSEHQMNQWAARYGLKSNPKELMDHVKNEAIGRYTALNLQNYYTIEFRLFRGTLKYNSLIAALQLVDAICSAAVFMSDEEMELLSWSSFVRRIYHPELIAYLKERRLYVNEPVVDTEEDQ